MNSINVKAEEVKPGDEIWSGPTSRFVGAITPWTQVKKVSRSGEYVVIETDYFDTWKHPREGVAIRRRADWEKVFR